ncbi:Uncharacterised protein [Streptococcus equinus]|uniref:sulfotransferase domain-containing protein n=1 Tax=Streptococcus equinus TaxID=1335 RepID=UPI000F705465|nr:sulfotransferase domain-containing protein [Streptococcus equinus]VEE22678.1 Uncharacterised protein [Streptococcus equinus]
MIIGACGYGATGSSVVSDLLREYDDIQVYDDFEFWMSYRVDGLEDLEYHLMKQYSKGESCDAAIRRFLRKSKSYMVPFINKPCNGKKFYELSKNFIDEITQVKFKGMYTAEVSSGYILKDMLAFASKKIIMPKLVEKIVRKRVYLWPCGKKYYSIEPNNFYDAAQNYTSAVLEAMGADLSKPICLDQPFSGNSPESSFNFYKNPKAIVVDKDPRDLYLAAKYTKDPNFKFLPIENIDDFITHYKNMRKKQKNDDRVMRINFEELIYEYDSSVSKIEKFLGVSDHKRKKMIFNPNRSINNTQLIRLHPEEVGNIKKIEEQLSEFLFDFNKYNSVSFNGKPFDGSSRKVFEQ